jgi:hypothetical protein
MLTVRRVLGASLALGTLLFGAGCSPGEEAGISREEYIDVYVQILLAAEEARDSVHATNLANAILEDRGLTEDDLLEFSNRYVDDPEELSNIWGEIEDRLRAPVEEEEEEGDRDPGDEDEPEEGGN